MRGYFVLLTGVAIVLGSPDRALALLIVSHDEWALSNRGFANAPDSAEAFALNIASLFAPDGSGDFLVHSQSFGLVEATLETTIADAGHTWTVDTTTPLDPATLASYDGVFLAGPVAGLAPDNAVLIDYLLSGGNVYLAGGTLDPSCGGPSSTGFCNAAQEMAAWDDLLRTFGLSFESSYNGIGGTGSNIPIASPHPLFAGVTELFTAGGLSVVDLDPADPLQEVIVSSGGEGLYAIAIPEPGCAALLLLGASVLAWSRNRHRPDEQSGSGKRRRSV
jgi:hypothetical protein